MTPNKIQKEIPAIELEALLKEEDEIQQAAETEKREKLRRERQARLKREERDRNNQKLVLLAKHDRSRIAQKQFEMNKTSFLYKAFTSWFMARNNTVPLSMLLSTRTQKTIGKMMHNSYGLSIITDIPNLIINLIRIMTYKLFASLYYDSKLTSIGLKFANKPYLAKSMADKFNEYTSSPRTWKKLLSYTVLAPVTAIASIAKTVLFPVLAVCLFSVNTAALISTSLFGTASKKIGQVIQYLKRNSTSSNGVKVAPGRRLSNTGSRNAEQPLIQTKRGSSKSNSTSQINSSIEMKSHEAEEKYAAKGSPSRPKTRKEIINTDMKRMQEKQDRSYAFQLLRNEYYRTTRKAVSTKKIITDQEAVIQYYKQQNIS